MPTPIVLIPPRDYYPLELWVKAELHAWRNHALVGVPRRALCEVSSVSEWIAGILTAGLLVYLFVALLKPEWFA